ncbi:MAG: GyrI-like domain-containing protein [Bacteroidota bacterium]|nr:GyrI-like domain-containing protein [Bacteroidota bacterium]MDP4234811.1 GyrI-like domain-containing protein [Bacteroidota bacterium]MDP4244177.1 GyrI-like domain-containing protein [Bacteroidota bacterium]MDP4289349.1 GyrI-like domain-containing protein [Bacteroidota bacterium]
METPIERPAFTVAGFSARTTNAREMSGEGVIAAMWQRVLSEGLIEKIPNRVDDNVIALYSNYESDLNGEYDFLIGARVKTAEFIAGLTVVTVPSARYAVLHSESGPSWKTVPETWKKVWETFGEERSYIADFELYDGRAADPHNMVVEVWVGVKR